MTVSRRAANFALTSIDRVIPSPRCCANAQSAAVLSVANLQQRQRRIAIGNRASKSTKVSAYAH